MTKLNASGACLFAVCKEGDTAATAGFQIFPPGIFRAIDGRPESITGWRVNAERVLADLATRQNDLPIYYEHQDVNAVINGLPAPAAGWIPPGAIQWDDAGLFATAVIWTDKAAQFIKSLEYRFISPYFEYDKSGAITRLINVSLVNSPALDGMTGVTAKEEEQRMPIKERILQIMGLPPETDDEAIYAALKQLTDKQEAAPIESTATAKAENTAALSEALNQIAALSAQIEAREKAELIAANATKLPTPGLKEWAQSQTLAALKEFLVAAPENAALAGMQTAGRAPAPHNELSPIERAVERMVKGAA
jgi:phage I-like protein